MWRKALLVPCAILALIYNMHSRCLHTATSGNERTHRTSMEVISLASFSRFGTLGTPFPGGAGARRAPADTSSGQATRALGGSAAVMRAVGRLLSKSGAPARPPSSVLRATHFTRHAQAYVLHRQPPLLAASITKSCIESSGELTDLSGTTCADAGRSTSLCRSHSTQSSRSSSEVGSLAAACV